MPYPYLAYKHMDVQIGSRMFSVFYEDSLDPCAQRTCSKHGTVSEGGKELVQVYEILDAHKMIEIPMDSSLGRKIIQKIKKEVESETYCEECLNYILDEIALSR
jgi:hypothetical protein